MKIDKELDEWIDALSAELAEYHCVSLTESEALEIIRLLQLSKLRW